MTTLTTICYQEFLDVYGLETDDKGLVVSPIPGKMYLYPNRIWTEFDDGHLKSGLHYVNCLRYVVSEKPYDKTALHSIDSREIDWTEFDEDAKERRISYMAKKMTDKPTSDLKWEAEAGIGWGLGDMLERARKNADDDIPWDEDLEYFETAYAAIQVMAKRLETAEAEVKRMMTASGTAIHVNIEPNKNQQDIWFIDRMETYYKNATDGDWTADGDGISSDKLEDEQVASNMYDCDADMEFAQNHMPRLLELANEAITLRVELKQHLTMIAEGYDLEMKMATSGAALEKELKAQLEYRIQDSQGIKDEADWVNHDEAQDTTIAACQALLKKYNLGDE